MAFISRIRSTLVATADAARENVWFWWQNLSRDDGEGELPLHGRARLSWREVVAFRFSWNLRSRFAHAYFDVDRGDAALTLSIALPPVALWFSVESWRFLHPLTERTRDRSVSLKFHDGCLWWRAWADPNTWSSKTPRWRDGNVSVVDLLLGREHVSSEPDGVPVSVLVPMPEGTYAGTCHISRIRRERPRWFSSTTHVAQLKLDEPVPVPGKGENSWDCDEDAIYSMSCEARTPAEAVAELVKSALRSRERHGSLDWRPEKARQAA